MRVDAVKAGLVLASIVCLATVAGCSRDANDERIDPPTAVGSASDAVAFFDGTVDVAKRQMQIVYRAPNGEITTQVILPYGQGANEVYLHTLTAQWEANGPLECTSDQLCGLVEVLSQFGGAVGNVRVAIDTTSPSTVTNDGPWGYGTINANGGSLPHQWTFTDPTATNFAFTGHVSGDLPGADAGADANDASDAAIDACPGDFTGIDGGTAPISVTSCRAITSPGNYVLKADLSSTQTCLNVHDTSNVHIDCAGHTVDAIPPLTVTNVTGFEIASCTLKSTLQPVVPIAFTSVSHGAIHASTSSIQELNIDTSDHVYVYSNTFAGIVELHSSTDDYVACNAATSPDSAANGFAESSILGATNGARNTFTRNTVNGQWDSVRLPTYDLVGCDDGIFLTQEDSDVVSLNTISNNYDCGIETADTVSNTLFSQNTIHNSGNTGIGGFYWNNWDGNTVTENVVDTAISMFSFVRLYGYLPNQPGIVFRNNTFTGNRFSNPFNRQESTAYIPLYANMGFNGTLSGGGDMAPTASQYFLTNNSFGDNTFGLASLDPAFGSPIVAGYVVDLGGNECEIPAAPLPFACSQ